MKKKIIILIIILVILGLILGFLVLRKNSSDDSSGFFGLFLGSGTNLPIGTDIPTNTNTGNASTTPSLVKKNRLVQITDFPAFGKIVNSQIIYYRRDLGHRYSIRSTDAHSQDAREGTRISNFTIPAVTSITISERGGNATLFSLENESTPSFFTLEHLGTTTTALLLPNSAKRAQISPSGDTVAILEETASGSQILLTTSDLQNPRIIYRNDLRDFELVWISEELLLLTSRPSALRQSVSIVVNVNGNNATLLSAVTALDVNFAPNGNDFLYSFIENGLLTLRSSSRDSNTSTTIPIKTFAEKCTWATNEVIYCAVPRPTGNAATVFPDDWLRGEISFSDILWKINTISGDIEAIADMSGFDIVNLSSNGDYLVFNNKNDSTLWSLQLFEDVQVPVETEEDIEG